MKLLLLILLSNYIFALCSPKEMTLSDRYYLQASQETTLISQLSLLDQALQSCYSPEIETTKRLIQAQNTQNIKEKISFYNQALVSISEFEDRELLIREQNKINDVIALLYEELDHQELAEIVKSKKMEDEKAKEPTSFLWVIVLFGVLSLWTVFNLIGIRKSDSSHL